MFSEGVHRMSVNGVMFDRATVEAISARPPVLPRGVDRPVGAASGRGGQFRVWLRLTRDLLRRRVRLTMEPGAPVVPPSAGGRGGDAMD